MKIAINDNCKDGFHAIKFDKKHRYIIYKIDGEQIVEEKTGERAQTWDSLLKALNPSEPRFAVFDLEFKSNDGINISKLFFLTWLPETKIKFKMLYATGKQAFKNYLDTNGKEIVINSVDDLTLEQLIKEFDK